MRKPVIAGNWKMHHAPEEARRFFGAFRPSWSGAQPDILVFPTAISFAAARSALPESPRVQLGVQNIHPEPRGAFTGELSAPMARAAGATHALAGHSERRHLFGESDRDAAARARAATGAGLVPVLCVGETLDERRAGRAAEVIVRQLDAALSVLSPEDEVMIAYEPVWAIGTGETATPVRRVRCARSPQAPPGGDVGRGPRRLGAHPLRRERESRERRAAAGLSGHRRGAGGRSEPRPRLLRPHRRSRPAVNGAGTA